MNPFFSIVVCTLGKIDQWKMSLESVLRQTFKDFEIIAIDSGPEKESRAVIRLLGDQRIKYVNTSKDDPRLNWDTGFRRSSGKFITWLDDDNYMLPQQLEKFAEVIGEKNADVVVGNHVHWRGLEHPIKGARNQLIIPSHLFSGKVIELDRYALIRDLIMSVPQGDRTTIPTRVGISMSTAKRELVEKLISKMKELSFGTTGSHALRIGLLALSRGSYFIDQPLTIGGQTGVSYSDVWPKDSSKIKLPTYQYHLSPFTANTYTNYRYENHLLIKHYLKEELADFTIDEAIVFKAHRRDLVFLDQSWKECIEKWSELFRFIKHSADPRIQKMRRETRTYFIKALGVKFLATFHLYGAAKTLLENFRKSTKDKIIIPLGSYGVTNIRECAKKLPEIIQNEAPELLPYFK